MALLQGWSGRIGKKKLKHIWKKNKSLRLLFMTEWKPLVIARTQRTWPYSRMSIGDVVQPCAFRPRWKVKKTFVTSPSPTAPETSDESLHQNLSISNRAYADLGHEVDSGKGLKTVILGRDTSWIDYCSACGKLDALEYYHVAGCYKLCSQKCFRDYIQRRKYILHCSQNTIFSRKSLQAVGTIDKEAKQPTSKKESDHVTKPTPPNNVNCESEIAGSRDEAKISKSESNSAKAVQNGDTMFVRKTKLHKSKFSIPLRIAFKSHKHHKKKYVKVSLKDCSASEGKTDVQPRPSENKSP